MVKIVLELPCESAVQTVIVTGSFDNWTQSVKATRESPDAPFKAVVDVEEGKIAFKFVVDGEWKTGGQYAVEDDGQGNVNCVLQVSAPKEKALESPIKKLNALFTHNAVKETKQVALAAETPIKTPADENNGLFKKMTKKRQSVFSTFSKKEAQAVQAALASETEESVAAVNSTAGTENEETVVAEEVKAAPVTASEKAPKFWKKVFGRKKTVSSAPVA